MSLKVRKWVVTSQNSNSTAARPGIALRLRANHRHRPRAVNGDADLSGTCFAAWLDRSPLPQTTSRLQRMPTRRRDKLKAEQDKTPAPKLSKFNRKSNNTHALRRGCVYGFLSHLTLALAPVLTLALT